VGKSLNWREPYSPSRKTCLSTKGCTFCTLYGTQLWIGRA
jgi:hypothetical protein